MHASWNKYILPPYNKNSNDIECVDELRILGIMFNMKNKDIATTNIEKKLPSIEKEILQWKRRQP